MPKYQLFSLEAADTHIHSRLGVTEVVHNAYHQHPISPSQGSLAAAPSTGHTGHRQTSSNLRNSNISSRPDRAHTTCAAYLHYSSMTTVARLTLVICRGIAVRHARGMGRSQTTLPGKCLIGVEVFLGSTFMKEQTPAQQQHCTHSWAVNWGHVD